MGKVPSSEGTHQPSTYRRAWGPRKLPKGGGRWGSAEEGEEEKDVAVQRQQRKVGEKGRRESSRDSKDSLVAQEVEGGEREAGRGREVVVEEESKGEMKKRGRSRRMRRRRKEEGRGSTGGGRKKEENGERGLATVRGGGRGGRALGEGGKARQARGRKGLARGRIRGRGGTVGGGSGQGRGRRRKEGGESKSGMGRKGMGWRSGSVLEGLDEGEKDEEEDEG
eukprot:CAMPEP_0205870580 /NCGR_PEP_ID=MMETSP1083-20121108/10636_1 /ASSEMBLY_ACC=CAM_ASM_000430 /TAXON_ID=97485 /ORGANISM="Prymnesium parvum, Strain Texoma1" /LENGTH=222 /DNA_ID=CAMNT_0053232875 /DNA_START=21 /DNA_END=689 /DNA_ORIENTATION=-